MFYPQTKLPWKLSFAWLDFWAPARLTGREFTYVQISIITWILRSTLDRNSPFLHWEILPWKCVRLTLLQSHLGGRSDTWLGPYRIREPLDCAALKLPQLPEALVAAIKWPLSQSPDSLQPSAFSRHFISTRAECNEDKCGSKEGSLLSWRLL